jgi:hypothetical protein
MALIDRDHGGTLDLTEVRLWSQRAADIRAA